MEVIKSVLFFIMSTQISVESTVFQCQIPSNESNQVTFPTVPGFDFDLKSAAALNVNSSIELSLLRRSRTYVFTIPPESVQRNCSGDIVAIQYCYQPRVLNANRQTFELLLLTQLDTELFRVERTFRFSSTSTSFICVNTSTDIHEICCDTAPIEDTTPLQIFSSSSMFGITIRQHRVLGFTSSAMGYIAPAQFQITLTDYPIPTDLNFTLEKSDQILGRPFPLMRFILEESEKSVTTLDHSDVTSDALTTNREVKPDTPVPPDPGNVGAVAGAVTAGTIIFVMVIVLLIVSGVFLLRKKGNKKQRDFDLTQDNTSHNRRFEMTVNESYITTDNTYVDYDELYATPMEGQRRGISHYSNMEDSYYDIPN